jgi:hypothetical protein
MLIEQSVGHRRVEVEKRDDFEECSAKTTAEFHANTQAVRSVRTAQIQHTCADLSAVPVTAESKRSRSCWVVSFCRTRKGATAWRLSLFTADSPADSIGPVDRSALADTHTGRPIVPERLPAILRAPHRGRGGRASGPTMRNFKRPHTSRRRLENFFA